MTDPEPEFQPPTTVERLLNRAMGALVRRGIGPRHMHLLEVQGRKTGMVHSVTIDLLEDGGTRYLVAPRGYSQWVRNAEVNGEVTVRRGREASRYQLRKLSNTEKPPVLKAYLDRFRREVQRYFPVPAGSPSEAFAEIAHRYPAFELVPTP